MADNKTLALIGCGLMGGSFALAAQQAHQVHHTIGYSVPHASAHHFYELGIIQSIAASAAEAVAQADIVLIAVPVAAMPSVFVAIAPALPDHALIMDVGSTKRSIIQAAQHHLGARFSQFIAAHPIAGKEKAGHSEPFAHLYQNKNVILCPESQSNPAYLKQAHSLWQAIGATPIILDADQHDRGLAAVSHLPHLLAFAYMDALLQQPDATDLLALGGPGFRDFSRIAGCDPTIWRDILPDNQDQILPLLHAVRQAIDTIENAMTQRDTTQLEAILQRASQARINWK